MMPRSLIKITPLWTRPYFKVRGGQERAKDSVESCYDRIGRRI